MENEMDLQDEIKVRLTPLAESFLLTATRWSKFLAILGFVYSGFIVILSFSIGSIMSIAAATNPMAMAGFPAILVSVIYLIIAVVSFFAAFFMYNFSVKTQRGIKLREEYSIESGMKAMKNYYMLMGILAIVGLSLFVLGLFVAIIAGVATAF